MAESFLLPASKLAPARMRRPVLDRPRLVRALHEAVGRRLVVVSAEAGYGKTCLLVSALARPDQAVAWLTLDETDTDLNLFGAGLLLALRQVAPSVGQGALDVLTTGPSQEVLSSAILRAVDELPAETVFVLDDFHVLDGSPAAHALVDRLLARASPRLHLVVASRTRPSLRGLPRLLVQGDALVLDRAALAFRADEARAFLNESFGLPVDDDQARDLAERTEGWAAALGLVAQAAQSRGLPALEGTPREIFEYLATSVLEGLPADLQDFALRTSVLFEFSPALCESVVGIADAASRLDALERRNLFVYRLDETGTRFRYHQLFSEFLRQRLARIAPALVSELHLRAGHHLEKVGEGDHAVRHYLLGGSYADAVRVLVPYRAGRLTAQRAYVFRDLVRRLPPSVAEAHPWLLRTAASSCRFVGDYEQALVWSRQAVAASEGKDPNLWAHAVHGVIVMLGNLGRLGEALKYGDEALARMPAGVEPGLRADVFGVLSRTCRYLGDVHRSARLNEQALRIDANPGSLNARSVGLLNRGHLALVRLEPSVALEAFRVALRYAEEQQSLPFQGMAWAGLAQSHIALGSVDAAVPAFEHACAIHGRIGERALDLQLSVVGGDLALLRGERSTAEAHYRRVLDDSRDGELAVVRVQASMGLAGAAGTAGEWGSALAHARVAADLARHGDLGSLLPVARLTEATMLAATRATASALSALREADRVFAAWGCRPGRARCAWLEARTLDRDGDRSARGLDAVLARAISLAGREPHEVVPWLRAEAAWVAPLLVRALTRYQRSAERLLVAIGAGAVEALLLALKRRDTRVPAVRALAAIGDPRARRALQQLCRDPDRHVRDAASRALGTIQRPSQPVLRVSMLGRFEVLSDGHAVSEHAWTTQKAKALVKLLVLHRPAGLHQEEAIEWLWPEQERVRGAASLKTAVKLARQALEPGVEGSASRALRREGSILRFAADDVWVDLDEHANLLASARTHQMAGRIDDAIADLERARALYRGDLLDPEDRYEEWAKPARERVQRVHLEGLVHLSHLRASRTDYAGAAEVMRAVLALDPLRESTYRDLMHYALLRGNRDEVFALYAECARKLQEELGVKPEPATSRLLEDARRIA